MVKCDICGKDFKNINSLRSHKSQQHKQINVNDKVNDASANKENSQDSGNINPLINVNDKGSDVNVNQVNSVNPDDINVNESPYSHTDLDLQKRKLMTEENDIINNDEEVRAVNELIVNFDEKDGAELYSMLIEIIGDFSGVDVEKDIPNWTEKTEKRGKRLSFLVNRYAEQYKQYIIPLMFVVGLGSDIMLIRKLGKMKKEINKINKNPQNKTDKVNEIKEINNINGVK